ncbi:UDP-glucose 4-epimerase GalE [Desulfovibrio ferrophilus]|uniref:UDP-glucose 4-epimerase n=1 Tax=Desulfovibrio ferrophilus TaxID=241368 RepID=A0A2Z6AXL0_9BACT|nr:UDP-glucose 4-epimerase GalE [Desulfovibrio ferrophilus]BBD08002.1 UDP-glucose 4-epimerase [Desulfovibrio ferrophilus]
MLPVLVTGGAGYIGSHTCKALARAGFTPIAVDNLVHGHGWAVKWGPLEQGDIGDRAFMDRVFARYRPVAVLHFAAFIAVGESVADPQKYYGNNVAGTLTLLSAMRAAACERIVFSSTAAVYGEPMQVPIAEAHPLAPVNPYGRSKLMIEQMLRDFDHAYGTGSICLRYFNAAGADPDGELGEEHDPETHLIPLAVGAALGKRPPLKIFGDDYDTPDGTALRDYIHVTDLAGAHVLAVKRLLDGECSEAYNLGTGTGNSVREIVDAVHRVSGKEVPYDFAPRREGDAARLVASAEGAKAALGWQPKYTDIETIVKTAWRWHAAR